jgi:hypothetical protein
MRTIDDGNHRLGLVLNDRLIWEDNDEKDD